MIYETKPEGFVQSFGVVGCFLTCRDRFLLLHRHPDKPEGNMWGAPAGTLEPGETLAEAMSREVHQETGLEIRPAFFKYHGMLYVVYPTYSFVYHTFSVPLPCIPEITINPEEHQGFDWKTVREALALPLVPDMDTCINLYVHI